MLFFQNCTSSKEKIAPSNESYDCYIFPLLIKINAVVTVIFDL